LSFLLFFFFSSRRRHTRFSRDWSSDVCSSDLLQNPVGLSRFSFWNGLMIDRLVYGNALAEKLRDGSTSDGIAGLQRIRWRNVAWVEEGSDGLPLYYDIHRGSSPYGQIRRVGPDDVIHFGRGVDPENPVAPSPLESAQHTIALYEAVVRHLKAFFENPARPSGPVQVEGDRRSVAA